MLFIFGRCQQDAEEPVGKSRDYANSMACTSSVSVSGTSEYWTRMIETEGVRGSFGSLVDVEVVEALRGESREGL